MPLLWGIAATRGSLSGEGVLLFVLLLFPYNYYLHAPNDYFDFETDARNPRKGGVEGALTPKPLLARHAIVSCLLVAPFLVATWALLPPLTTVSLGTLLILSAAYNAPPTRLKGRPILDSLTNVLYAIPLQIGLHAGGSTALVDAPVLVFAAWGIGAHALTTITDRDEDAAAGVRTIAVLLGRRGTALFAAAWFLLVGAGAASITDTPAAALLAAPYLALRCDRIFGFGDRAGGGPGFRNELIWSYGLGGSSPRCHAKKHDTLLWYSKGSRWFFAPHMVPATSQRLAGKLKKGTSIWEIPSINNMAKERTGYPTQKPLPLLERIVACHAPPGGLVADLCCGSGTTLVAAASAGRRAIGADLGALAQEVAGGRLLAAGLGLERWTPATD